jgi:hypothetical protein
MNPDGEFPEFNRRFEIGVKMSVELMITKSDSRLYQLTCQ